MFLFFVGCFAPEVGEWGWFDVDVSGDCSVDQSQTPDGTVRIEEDGTSFSLIRGDDSFSCALTGMDFLCTSSERTVESDEVTLSVLPSGSGGFTSSVEGVFLIREAWSCTSGACDTYGLNDCTKAMEGSLGLLE